MYETSSNRWQSVTCENSPEGKAGHAAVVIRDMMVLFGGSHGHGIRSVLHIQKCLTLTVLFFEDSSPETNFTNSFFCRFRNPPNKSYWKKLSTQAL